MVVEVIYKVDGAATHFATCRQHRLMDVLSIHPLAAEIGNEPRMNIDDAVFKVWRDENVLQESTHHYELRSRRSAWPKDCFAIRLWGKLLLLLRDQSLDPRFLGKLQPFRPRIARHHQADLRVQFPLRNSFDEIAQRRPSAGDEDGDGK